MAEKPKPIPTPPLLDAQNRLVHDGFDPSDDLYEAKREGELFDGANEAHEPPAEKIDPDDDKLLEVEGGDNG